MFGRHPNIYLFKTYGFEIKKSNSDSKLLVYLKDTHRFHDKLDTRRWVHHGFYNGDVILLQCIQSCNGGFHGWHGNSQCGFTVILFALIFLSIKKDRHLQSGQKLSQTKFLNEMI